MQVNIGQQADLNVLTVKQMLMEVLAGVGKKRSNLVLNSESKNYTQSGRFLSLRDIYITHPFKPDRPSPNPFCVPKRLAHDKNQPQKV